MRIVVLGDFHLHADEFDLTTQAIEDISECRPDLVVPLGDFGCNASIGSVDGLRQAYGFLGQLRTPMRPILGNHDMQRETGDKGLQSPGTMRRAFLELFGLDDTNGIIDTEHARLIFIGTDLQPADSCYSDQECFVTDTHYEELLQWLGEAGERPVILFTHAPMAGAGLRTVPRVHVRATNAYLDQNHHFDRWLELVRRHPNIKLWFSAHYHLGHDYPDSHTERYGTAFFMTGVHSSSTRDGTRVSRVIDVDTTGVRVSTLDHVQRELRPEPDWSAQWSEVAGSGTALEAAASSALSMETAAGGRLLAVCAIGDEPALANGVIALSGNRCLVATMDGCLWELAPFEEAVLGTLHLGAPLSAAAVSGGGVWRAWDRKLVRVDRERLDRFQRHLPLQAYPHMREAPGPIDALAPRSDGGVWVACDYRLLALTAEEGIDFACVRSFESPILKLLTGADGGVYALTKDGILRLIDAAGAVRAEFEDVIDWDASPWEPGVCAGLLQGDDGRTALIATADGRLLEAWPVGPETLRIVSLGGQCAAWIEGADCRWRNGSKEGRLPLADDVVRIDAAARLPDHDKDRPRLGLAVSSSARHVRPSLQVWEIGD